MFLLHESDRVSSYHLVMAGAQRITSFIRHLHETLLLKFCVHPKDN
jgi:hypothetical protein